MSKQNSTSRLKTMLKNSNRHTMRNLSRIFKYGVIGFMRNIWLSITATIVTTLTLVLLFATIVAGSVLSATADNMREKIDISIFFQPGTEKKNLISMANTMKKDQNVKSVNVSTSEEEFQKLKQEYIESDNQKLLTTIELVGESTFIKKQPAAMRIKVYNTNDLSSIKAIVNTNSEFKEYLHKTEDPTYDANSSAISTISSWANIAPQGGTALCVLFLVISTLVIFNTIRMAIYSRSEEIYMMKLVGADNSFIRGPFMIEAMLSGIFAGLLAGTINLIGYQLLTPKLKSYEISVGAVDAFLADSKNIFLVFFTLISVGIVITFISSRLAIHKYLKRF